MLLLLTLLFLHYDLLVCQQFYAAKRNNYWYQAKPHTLDKYTPKTFYMNGKHHKIKHNFRVNDAEFYHTFFLNNSNTETWWNNILRIRTDPVTAPSSKDPFFQTKPTTPPSQSPFPPIATTEKNPYLQPLLDVPEEPLRPSSLTFPSDYKHPATTLQPEYSHTPSPTGPTLGRSSTFPADIPRSPTDPSETEGTLPETIDHIPQIEQTHPPFVKIWMEEMAKYQTSTYYFPKNIPDYTSMSISYHHPQNMTPFDRTQTKTQQTSGDRPKVKRIERQGQTTLDPVFSSVREQLFDDYREYLATLHMDEQKEQTTTVEDIGHEPSMLIPTEEITDEPHNQVTTIKESDPKPDKNEEIIKEMKKSLMLEKINVANEPDKEVTSDRDEKTTEKRENIEDRVITEDGPIDEREDNMSEKVDIEDDSKTIESSDESDKTLMLEGMDDGERKQLGEILRMVRKDKYKKKKHKAVTEETSIYLTPTKPRKIEETKSILYRIFNYDYLEKTTTTFKEVYEKTVTRSTIRNYKTSTHKKVNLMKIIKRPITVKDKTKHKRLHVNKLLREPNNVRKVEPQTKRTTNENENDETAETTTSTTAVQINIKRMPQTTTTMLPYFQMIDDLNEGYMVVFLIELMRIMASKDKDDLYEVLVHTEQIVLQLYTAGQIVWLGQPLLDITKRLAKFMTEAETGVTQHYASKLKRKIVGRQLELSSEVNIIIDYADMLYDDEEGRKLFSVLKDFDDYPNITQAGFTLCSALIENFLKPYRRLSNTELRQQLIDSINLELRARIPEADLSEWNPLTFLGVEEAIKQWPSVESDSETSVSASKRNQNILRQKLQKLKPKRKHPSIQRISTKIQPDYSSENIYRRKFSYRPETQYEYPLLRNMKPIRNIQRRFKIITPRHRQKMLRHWSTPSYIVNLISRPTKEFTTKLNKVQHQASTRFPFFLETVRFRTKHRNEDRIENLHNRNAINYHKNKTHFYNGMKDRIRQMTAARKAERLKTIRN